MGAAALAGACVFGRAAALAGMRVCALRSIFAKDHDLKLANLLFSGFDELLPFARDW